MRIAIFSAYFPPHIGGVEQYTLNIASQLTGMGHEVTVVTSALADNPKRDEFPFSIIGIPSASVMGGPFLHRQTRKPPFMK